MCMYKKNLRDDGTEEEFMEAIKYSSTSTSVSIEPWELNSKYYDYQIINGQKWRFTKPEQMPKWELSEFTQNAFKNRIFI